MLPFSNFGSTLHPQSDKVLSRLTNAEEIGPILLGMGAPVHVLQAGGDVEYKIA